MKSKKIGFIADFFKSELLGGAEANNDVLIRYLQKKGFEVERIKSSDAKIEEDVFYIVANFVGLNQQAGVELMKHQNYIISEHDHKYAMNRDPSRFPDFLVPSDMIVNRDFYARAKGVVVLSDICKKVMEKNLEIENVHSIGCSLWSKEKLGFLKEIQTVGKNGKVAIVDSDNPTKGRADAIAYCENNDVKYDLIKNSDENEFLKTLASYEKLVFIPQVLETFCRLAAEAKMLNVKLVTMPALLGFASEDCFKLSGEALIEDMSKRVDKALKHYEGLIK